MGVGKGVQWDEEEEFGLCHLISYALLVPDSCRRTSRPCQQHQKPYHGQGRKDLPPDVGWSRAQGPQDQTEILPEELHWWDDRSMASGKEGGDECWRGSDLGPSSSGAWNHTSWWERGEVGGELVTGDWEHMSLEWWRMFCVLCSYLGLAVCSCWDEWRKTYSVL